jgi:Protein of unknown function (DUF5672)/Glycosyl transferases group 1
MMMTMTAAMIRQHQQAKLLMRAAVSIGLLLYGYLLVVQQGLAAQQAAAALAVRCHPDDSNVNDITAPSSFFTLSSLKNVMAARQQQRRNAMAATAAATAAAAAQQQQEQQKHQPPLYFDLPSNLTTHEIVHRLQNKRRHVLMFSPYDFSTGGGEKYFLQVAAFFQQQDYTVTISSFPTNYCQTKQCIIDTADTLDVQLTNDFYYFLLDYPSGRQLREQPGQYDIYYEMGNSKYIQYGGPPGAFTLYQCQFPFDSDNVGTELNHRDLPTVDIVIVNSEYTKMHYLDQTKDLFRQFLSQGSTFPTVEIVYPPVSLLDTPSSTTTTSVTTKKNNNHNNSNNKPTNVTVISMLGRIFTGRQSKGHLAAVEAVRRLHQQLRLRQRPGDNNNDNHHHQPLFELHIIGNVQPGFEEYATNLTRLAQGLPIIFHYSVKREELQATLARSHFVWHLTGIDAENDPASNEHFGISLVEAMSVGAVPIHFHLGGAREASKGCGYEIDSIDSLVSKTIEAMQLSPPEFAAKSSVCHSAAQSFSIDKFTFHFERLLTRSRLTRNFYQNANQIPHLQSHDSPVVAAASTNGKHSAYIYVHAPSIHVPYAVRNIMKTLGEEWNLYVGVQPKMRQYVEPLLANVQNVRFLEHEQLNAGLVTDYSKMMMSSEFWNLFETEYILIFQPDCVMFYNDMDHFIGLGAPMLGAPWCPDNEVFAQHIVQWRVGNGGFSLRRKSWMQKCIASDQAWHAYNALKKIHGATSGPLSADNEDVFFNVCVKELVPEWDTLWKYEAEAAHFAVEVPCGRGDDYMQQGIMAGHAFWYYTDSTEHQKLLNGRPPERNTGAVVAVSSS